MGDGPGYLITKFNIIKSIKENFSDLEKLCGSHHLLRYYSKNHLGEFKQTEDQKILLIEDFKGNNSPTPIEVLRNYSIELEKAVRAFEYAKVRTPHN